MKGRNRERLTQEGTVSREVKAVVAFDIRDSAR
jgi:hypothetical protein